MASFDQIKTRALELNRCVAEFNFWGGEFLQYVKNLPFNTAKLYIPFGFTLTWLIPSQSFVVEFATKHENDGFWINHKAIVYL